MAFHRLSESDKHKINDLYLSGTSGVSIAKVISYSKSAINSYLSKIFGKRVQRGKMKLNLRSEEKVGEFIGAFAGDGNLYYSDKKGHQHYQISIFTDIKEREYANHLFKLMKELFGREPHIRLHKGMRGYTTLVVQVNGKEAVNLIREFLTFHSGNGEKKTYTVKLSHPIEFYSKNFLRGFIDGLIASDGSIYFKYHPGRKRFFKNIEINLTSKELALQYCSALSRFDIKSHFYTYLPKIPSSKPVYAVQIKALSEMRKFYYKIGLSEKRKLAKLENIMLASVSVNSFNFFV